MSRDLNQVIIIGRLVKDPEIKYTANGTPVTKFSIANNTSYMQNNNLVEYANYFDVNVWGNQAVSCEKYLKKGSMVAINGSLRQQRWDDKTTGQKRSKIEITANSVQFLSPVGTSQGANKQPTTGEKKNVPNNNQMPTKQSEGMIVDPWNDGANAEGFDEAFNPGQDGDDDIPF